MYNILVIEDDAAIRDMLHAALDSQGYQIDSVANGETARKWVSDHNPDLILLDWMLPDTTGPELLKEFRKNSALSEIPVIMLTARAAEEDRIRGLETGADDYVTKPFSVRELIARIKALIRRTHRLDSSEKITVGPLQLDPENQKLEINGQRVKIGPTEFRLLKFFMRTPGRLYTRSQLLDKVWGQGSFIEERTVDVHILRLRKLLKKHGVTGLVETVRNAGYRMNDQVHEQSNP